MGRWRWFNRKVLPVLEDTLLAYEAGKDSTREQSENVGKVALGQSPQPVLSFNNIPNKCLIDKADLRYKKNPKEPCQICGAISNKLYLHYDLRVKQAVPEMVLLGRWQICALCKKTIFHGAHKKLFRRSRKTTKHYMAVKKCDYDQFLSEAKTARKFKRLNRKQKLYIYFSVSYLPLGEYYRWTQYFHRNGIRFDTITKRWFMRPIHDLWRFKYFL